jgi:uncharacterized membrane protein
MNIYIKLYAIALPVFLAIDMVWLMFIAKGFYTKHFGALLRTDINFLYAAVLYMVLVAGLVFFVIAPSVEAGSVFRAVLLGAFFGLVVYATYDLTNLVTLKNWSLTMTVVDIAWGATISAIVAAVTTKVVTFFA